MARFHLEQNVLPYINEKQAGFIATRDRYRQGSLDERILANLAADQNRVRFLVYSEIIFMIAEAMDYEISDEEVLEWRDIPGLSFENIFQKIQSRITQAQSNRS